MTLHPHRGAILGWALSLALHLGAGAAIVWTTTAPDLGVEFQLPTTIEFGLTEAAPVKAPGAAAPGAPNPSPTAPAPEVTPAESPTPEPGPEPVPAREARRRARARRAAKTRAQRRATAQTASGVIPPGAQVALRIDVEAVRDSPLAPSVQGLLERLPDWRALLQGSGIAPLESLDRLLVASPNLRRSRLIAAGRARGGRQAIRAAATSLAEAAGQELVWQRKASGIDVARWYNRDVTERTVALLGDAHFVLCRPQDLARVLAVAAARGQGRGGLPAAEALLAMDRGDAITLEIEGLRHFVRRSSRSMQMVPLNARFRLAQETRNDLRAHLQASYDGSEAAGAAAAFWDRARSAFAGNILAQVLGVGPVLQRTRIAVNEDHWDGEVALRLSDVERLLVLLTRSLGRPPPDQGLDRRLSPARPATAGRVVVRPDSLSGSAQLGASTTGRGATGQPVPSPLVPDHQPARGPRVPTARPRLAPAEVPPSPFDTPQEGE